MLDKDSRLIFEAYTTAKKYLPKDKIAEIAYEFGRAGEDSPDMPFTITYNNEEWHIEDNTDNWEIWANAWNEGYADIQDEADTANAWDEQDKQFYGD